MNEDIEIILGIEAEMTKEEELRQKVLAATKEYYIYQYGKKKSFSDGDRISYGGRVFDEQELVNLVDASLDFWLT